VADTPAALSRLSLARDVDAIRQLGRSLGVKGISDQPLVEDKDVLTAIDPTDPGFAPSGPELLKRAGVPQLGALSDIFPVEKGGLLDITGRGVLGTAAEIIRDPLSILSFGASSAAKKAAKDVAIKAAKKEAREQTKIQVAKKFMSDVVEETARLAVSPVTRPLDKAGRKLFEKGTAEISAAGLQARKTDIAETFFRHGIFGNASQIKTRALAAEKRLLTNRNKLLTVSDQVMDRKVAEGAISPLTADAMFAEAKQGIDELLEATTLFKNKKEATDLFEELAGTVGTGDNIISLKRATNIKTELDKAISDSVRFQKSAQGVDELRKLMADSARRAVETKMDNLLGQGAGNRVFKGLNKDLGNLITPNVRKAINSAEKAEQAAKRSFGNVIDKGDLAAVGLGGCL